MWCDKIMIKWTETLDYMFNVLQMIDPVPVRALLLYWVKVLHIFMKMFIETIQAVRSSYLPTRWICILYKLI